MALDSFARDFGLLGASGAYRDTLQGNIVSTFQAGCFFGSLLTFPLADRIGRKRAILVAASVFIVGGALMTAAKGKLALLIAGRAVAGLGIGASSLIVPVYIAETSPPSIRGRLIGIFEVRARRRRSLPVPGGDLELTGPRRLDCVAGGRHAGLLGASHRAYARGRRWSRGPGGSDAVGRSTTPATGPYRRTGRRSGFCRSACSSSLGPSSWSASSFAPSRLDGSPGRTAGKRRRGCLSGCAPCRPTTRTFAASSPRWAGRWRSARRLATCSGASCSGACATASPSGCCSWRARTSRASTS